MLFEFTGRFHPLFVHLPIGILLIAVIFIWLNDLKRIEIPAGVIRLTLALGALSAISSVITGLALEQSGDYDADAVGLHKYMGITLTIVTIGLWLAADKPKPVLKWGSLGMMILVVITGHLGGSLTHGTGYLTSEVSAPEAEVVINLEGLFYKDAVKPILAARCYSCHGDNKQKGKLRLDTEELIMKGGKSGKVIEPGNPEESELVQRLDLPLDDEDHMPPKEKKQLTDQEKRLISLWIAAGADFTKPISALANPKQVAALRETTTNAIALPDVDVRKPDEELLAKLTEQGIAITPVAAGSNFLSVNFVSAPDQPLTVLTPLAENVVSMKLTNAADLSALGNFKNLMNLNLSGTKISSVSEVIKCSSIVSLNLSGTDVTDEEVGKLAALKNLRLLNLYNTPVSNKQQLIAALPNTTIEFGGYEVPTLETDTTYIKAN